MFLKTKKHSLTTNKVGRDMDGGLHVVVKQGLSTWMSAALLVDSVAIDRAQINSKHYQSEKELDMWQSVTIYHEICCANSPLC